MIRILIYLLGAYLLYRWLIRPYLRFVVADTVEKMNQQQRQGTYEKPKAEGTITVQTKKENSKIGQRAPKDEGFVDYTEIK